MTYDSSSAAVIDSASTTEPVDTAPRVAAGTAVDDSGRPVNRDTTKSAKIMIVDDEPINIKVVQKYLHGHGFSNFITTSDATRAMDIFRAQRPDIALLDIMMPEVSGIEILQQVRDAVAGNAPDIPGRVVDRLTPEQQAAREAMLAQI